MKSKFVFSIGDGRRVRFWEDRWCGDEALSLSFPSLYALVTSKEAWVVEVWDASGEEGGWNPRFSRPFNEWQMEMVERFLFSLQGKRAVTNLGDRIQWKEAKDGNISVNSFYSAMEGSSTIPFLKSIICSTFIPTKIGFFAWEASCNKALTLDQLKKRGWYFLNKCYLFCVAEESIDHLLIHGTKARVVWELLFNLFGASWVLPSSVKEILLGWHGSFVGKKRVKVWRTAPLCLFWTVWKGKK